MSIASRIESITNHLTDDWNSIDRLGLHTNILPKEYTQVDYIESNGTQYIDTGINADSNLKVDLDVAFTASSTANQNIGAINLSDSTLRYHIICRGNSNNVFSFGVYENLYGTYPLDSNRHLFVINPKNGEAKVDSETYTIPTTSYDVGLNFYLFGRNSTGTIYLSKVRQWACKMYYNDALVRDFIPCFRNTDNEVGLYDIVNDVFYTNQGTGTFTYGQVQEQHIDKNIENIKEPLDLFYNEVSDKTDLSQNGVVGRTSQETTTGKNVIISRYSVNTSIYSYDIDTDLLKNTMTYSFISSLTTEATIYVRSKYNNDYIYQKGTLSIVDNAINTITFNLTNEEINNLKSVDTIIQIYKPNAGFTSDTISKAMLEEGSTATSYEPYTYGASPNPDFPQSIHNLIGNVSYKITTQNDEEIFTIPLGDIELCKINTYEDKIYSDNGKFYLKKAINKTVLNGNENWVLSRITGATNTTRYRINNADFSNVSNLSYCDKFINRTASMSPGDYECILSNNNTIYISIFINRLSEDTSAAFKSWLSSHNTIVYYPVVTPTITEITSSNYPELYASLKEIQNYLTSYKINKEFVLNYPSPEIEY